MNSAVRIEQICRELLRHYNSANRLEGLIRLTLSEPAGVFWGVMLGSWAHCDDTWDWRAALLDLMREHAAQRPDIGGLAFPLLIYRGCSRPRVRGVSWTTDRAVAEGFARGHRGISVPDPVIAEALVERAAVFLAINDRNESDVLIDPRRLRQLKVHVYAPAAAVVA